MSLRVTGYQNGRRIVVDEGHARARVAGYGGSALGHTMTPMLPTQARRAVLAAAAIARGKDRVRCGAPVFRTHGICARNPGHGNWHRSAEALEANNERRRR